MGMNNLFLRPISKAISVVVSFIVTTISGERLTDQTGDPLRTIQDA